MKTILINTANLKTGGAIQVANSFIFEASKQKDIFFWIVLGRATKDLLVTKANYINIRFKIVEIVPTDNLFSYFKYNLALKKIEDECNPVFVITVFGPCYWKPKTKHIMGYAYAHFIYEDSYYIKNFENGYIHKLRKYFKRYRLKHESKFFWVETNDAKNRLSLFLNIDPENIVMASNNCSNIYHQLPYRNSIALPPKTKTRAVYISSYYKHKGFEIIPKILDILSDKNIEIEVLITIDENNFKKLRHPNLLNIGKLSPEDCPYVYSTADIIFIPSNLETFSASFPEAMVMLKPIITCDLPFARDICGDAALYFIPNSPEDAANKIIKLINDTELQKRLIENGQNRLKSFDTPKQRFEKILDFVNSKL